MFKGIQNCKKDKILFDFGWFRKCLVYSHVENSSKDFINERQYVNEKKNTSAFIRIKLFRFNSHLLHNKNKILIADFKDVRSADKLF